MTKQRKRKPATLSSDADFLAEQMAAVATMMWATSERMAYFAGLNVVELDKAHRLAGVSAVLKIWAREVREKANNQKGGGK
jgi:hypothetical protein